MLCSFSGIGGPYSCFFFSIPLLFFGYLKLRVLLDTEHCSLPCSPLNAARFERLFRDIVYMIHACYVKSCVARQPLMNMYLHKLLRAKHAAQIHSARNEFAPAFVLRE